MGAPCRKILTIAMACCCVLHSGAFSSVTTRTRTRTSSSGGASNTRTPTFFASHPTTGTPFRIPTAARTTPPSRRGTCRLLAAPAGRVDNVDDWIRLSSESLKKLSGTSLLDRMEGCETIQQVDTCTRYAVLSHGTQSDPVYNYFNQGAFLTFQFPEAEVYQLPSRYSAPGGKVRSDRTTLMQAVVEQDVMVFPTAIRQTKAGDRFQLQNVTLWNVFDDDGVRVGQTALFDRERIVSAPEESNTEGSEQ